MTQSNQTGPSRTHGSSEDEQAARGSLLTRVPGRARPRTQALKEFEENAEALRRGSKPVFWSVLVPKAENMYRWRVQLECSCVHELYTRGEDDYPDAHRWLDQVAERRLPNGEFWCPNDHGEVQKVYRDVAQWIDSRVKEIPPDPEECPYAGIDAETWAKTRRPEPRSWAFWRVRLACGHVHEPVLAEVGWKPEDGPKLVSEARAAEMRSELEALWSAEGYTGWPREGAERDNIRTMLDLRWPRPEPEQECLTCRYARRITGYQRIGWLKPRTDTKKPSDTHADAERRKAEARLAKVEAEARRLRLQLGLPLDE